MTDKTFDEIIDPSLYPEPKETGLFRHRARSGSWGNFMRWLGFRL